MKINPRQIEKMARKMGMQMNQIDAEEVIIKTPEKDIVISNPQVSKINMSGQESFQISGDVSEKEKQPFSNEDIKMIMDQTNASEEEAKKAITETGDIADAILKLKDQKTG